MPIIRTTILAGRPYAAKQAFAKAVTDAAVEHLGIAAPQVRVLIEEIEPEHWFVAGEPKSPPA